MQFERRGGQRASAPPPTRHRLYLKDNITLGEERGNTFIMLLKERRKGDCGNAINSKCSENSSRGYTRRPNESECLWKKMIGKPDSGKPTVRLCVQRRLVCSTGGSPVMAKVRSHVVRMAG